MKTTSMLPRSIRCVSLYPIQPKQALSSMKDGVIQQIGTPQEVYNSPANMFVAGFIGVPQMNFYAAKLVKNGSNYAVEVGGVTIDLSAEKSARLAANNAESQEITVGVRPEHVELKGDASKMIKATVDVSEMMGSQIYLHGRFIFLRYLVVA